MLVWEFFARSLTMLAARNLMSLAVPTLCVLFFWTGESFAVQPQAAATGVVAQLKSIRAVLEQADHDYKGHRAKAVHEITKAIHALEGVNTKHAALTPQQRAALKTARQAKAATQQATGKANGEPQAQSDAQLNAALTQLTQVSAQMGSAKPVAQQYIQNALAELKAALAAK
jgi:hypothetical protein